jgi:hypothetical protein
LNRQIDPGIDRQPATLLGTVTHKIGAIAMSAASLSSVAAITVDDLQELGFTESQIASLIALKSAYPFIEYVDTSRQWQRLQFLKWRYQNGDLQRR